MTTLKYKRICKGEDETIFSYEDVKEAVLEFESYLRYLRKITNNPSRYNGLIKKHKQIFGDFEK